MADFDLIVIGGGAAGVFAALAAVELKSDARVAILEKSSVLLAKVRISGGGRCNVTHACFDPLELSRYYPRGQKALIGPFTRFQPRDTIEWFNKRGVDLKIEADGRCFPVTDSSETIIDCLLKEAKKGKVEIRLKQNIIKIMKDREFAVILDSAQTLTANSLLLATGSHPSGHAFAKFFGHKIESPVPSLFTFNVREFDLKELAGISVQEALLSLSGTQFQQTGPLLITHWGFSGPAALKLSAWAARVLHEKQYETDLIIDWIPNFPNAKVLGHLKEWRKQCLGLQIAAHCPFDLPKNLWKKLLSRSQADGVKRIGDLSNESLQILTQNLKMDSYRVSGKTTHKEEFVTCGGVDLDEVNFKTMESKRCQNLYFAGEILDVDAVTGGFNFQNAWTTGWIAGRSAVS